MLKKRFCDALGPLLVMHGSVGRLWRNSFLSCSVFSDSSRLESARIAGKNFCNNGSLGPSCWLKVFAVSGTRANQPDLFHGPYFTLYTFSKIMAVFARWESESAPQVSFQHLCPGSLICSMNSRRWCLAKFKAAICTLSWSLQTTRVRGFLRGASSASRSSCPPKSRSLFPADCNAWLIS
mgnify:CR=1 FL=1